MHVKSQHEWSSWHVLPTLLNGWEAYNLLKRLVPLNASSFRYLWLIVTRIYHKYQNFDFSRSPSSKSTNGKEKAAWFHCSCSLHPPPRLSLKKKKNGEITERMDPRSTENNGVKIPSHNLPCRFQNLHRNPYIFLLLKDGICWNHPIPWIYCMICLFSS